MNPAGSSQRNPSQHGRPNSNSDLEPQHPFLLQPLFSSYADRPSSSHLHSTSLSNSRLPPHRTPGTPPRRSSTNLTNAVPIPPQPLHAPDDILPAIWPFDESIVNNDDDDIQLPRLPPIESQASAAGWSVDALDHFYSSEGHLPLSDFASQDFSSPSTYPSFTSVHSHAVEHSRVPVQSSSTTGHPSTHSQHLGSSHSASTSATNLSASAYITDVDNSASSSSLNFDDPFDALVLAQNMPPLTRRRASMRSSEPRLVEPDADQPPASKRQRTTAQSRVPKKENQSQPKPRAPRSDDPFADLDGTPDSAKREDGEEPYMIDLTETPTTKEEPVPEKPEKTGWVKLSEFTCAVCMDSATTLTVTHCGHVFCAQCLHSSLHVNSQNKGKCPMCRQKIDMKARDSYNSKTKGIWPLELKLMTSNRKGKRKASGMS